MCSRSATSEGSSYLQHGSSYTWLACQLEASSSPLFLAGQ